MNKFFKGFSILLLSSSFFFAHSNPTVTKEHNKKEMKKSVSRFFKNLSEYTKTISGQVYDGVAETWQDFIAASEKGCDTVIFESSEARKAAAEKAGYTVQTINDTFQDGKKYMLATFKKKSPKKAVKKAARKVVETFDVDAAKCPFNNADDYAKSTGQKIYTDTVKSTEDFTNAVKKGYRKVMFEANVAKERAAEKAGFTVARIKNTFSDGHKYMIATLKDKETSPMERDARVFETVTEYKKTLTGKLHEGRTETVEDFERAANNGYVQVVFKADAKSKKAAETAGYFVEDVKDKIQDGKYMIATLRKRSMNRTPKKAVVTEKRTNEYDRNKKRY